MSAKATEKIAEIQLFLEAGAAKKSALKEVLEVPAEVKSQLESLEFMRKQAGLG